MHGCHSDHPGSQPTPDPEHAANGLFVNDNDVFYYEVTQKANQPLVITLDVNAANTSTVVPDFDLYASTTTETPDDSDFGWRAYEGNGTGTIDGAGAVLVIPGNNFLDRAVYIGVHNFAGRGHFSIRANLISGNRTLTICTQDATPAQVMADSGWANVKETIQRTLARNFAATNGNLWIDNVILKLQAGGLQSGWTEASQFCPSDGSCDWCMTGYGLNSQGMDGCGEQTNSQGRVRIPNHKCQGAGRDNAHDAQWDQPAKMSKRLEHESGHGLGRMVKHTDVGLMLADQYSVGPEDAHTVMNDPVDFPDQTNVRYSTDFNHCKPFDPQNTQHPTCSQSTSDWTRIQNSGWTTGRIYPIRRSRRSPGCGCTRTSG